MTAHDTITQRPAGKHNNGFTLVELSIVLVIIGLILGGILVGQDMVRSSQVRSVIADVEAYKSAAYMFQDKYGCIPGDCTNATTYWTAAANGDGDGQLDNATAASTVGERFGVWQQLALAGMIKGIYSGIAGSGSALHSIPGTNGPTGSLAATGYGWFYSGTLSSNSIFYDGYYGNTLYFGTATTSSAIDNAALTPSEAYQIDIKMDDGIPGTGSVRTYHSGSRPNCVTGGAAAASTSSYKIATYTGVACMLMFLSGF